VQFLFSRFLPIPCLCLTAAHPVITPVQVKIGCQCLSPAVFLFHYQGLHQFSPREITVTESNFFGEITTSSDPWSYGTQLFPCAAILLVFNCFITNCYIYENSTVWIILPLSKFPGKIGGVTPVPLKTQSPRQNFLGHIYPSYYLSVYIQPFASFVPAFLYKWSGIYWFNTWFLNIWRDYQCLDSSRLVFVNFHSSPQIIHMIGCPECPNFTFPQGNSNLPT